MTKLKVLVGALLLVAIVGVGYLSRCAKLRNDCEGLMIQEIYLRAAVAQYPADPYLFETVVLPVATKRAQVCTVMYEEFGFLWPDKDPFHVGR